MEYTANIFSNNTPTRVFSDNNLSRLLAKLLGHLESENDFSTGNIMHNYTGKIVHRCCKVVCGPKP